MSPLFRLALPLALLLTARFGPIVSATAAAVPRAADRPNIIVILADDMGFSDLGCYGGEIRTPHLDALAANGVRFTQFYNTARCCPTRASLLTGLYPHQAGVGHMMEDKGPAFPGYRGDLSASTPTIAEVLRTAGYRTYMAGKWHVTRHIEAEGPKHNWPLQRGFDRFYGMISGGGSFYDPFTLTRSNQLISPFADPDYQPKTYYFTDALSEHAVRFVRDHSVQHGGEPFFLYLAYTAAHWPMHALPEDIARYRGMYDQGYEPIRKARFEKAARLGLIDADQEMSLADADWDQVANKAREIACMEVYAAMVDRMDQGIGRLVTELKATGQLDNTLILFLQDNGGCAEDQGRLPKQDRIDGPRPDQPTLPVVPPEALPNGLVPPQTRDGYPVRQGLNVIPGPADTYIAYGRGWANVSNTPFREYKHWVHEGGISTPLIAHWPKGIPARGELRRQPGHVIDIMATCLDVAAASYPSEFAGQVPLPIQGKSLVPAFANRPIDREALYWEHEGNRAIRVGDWKLVAKGPGAPWELYHLATDRTELHNLARNEPEKVLSLSRSWESWARRSNVLQWIWKPPYAPRGPRAARNRAGSAVSPPPLRREFRAAWVASVGNIDWPSRPGLTSNEQQREAIRILDAAVRLNLNAVVLQVRPSADALYESRLEPWSAYLSGKQGQRPEPFYDPLAFWIAEAHRRGLLLHAWFNPYRARAAGAHDEESPDHISQSRPHLTRSYGGMLWMDPGEPQARQHTIQVILDVVRRYDVDGIHMDDYFYPYPVTDSAKREIDFPDTKAWRAYRGSGGSLSRPDWRRRNIDQLVETLSQRINAEKPTVLFGISPFGIPRPGRPPGVVGFDQYEKLYADPIHWLHEGWCDYLSPQLYWKIDAPGQPFRPLLNQWIAENRHDRHIWPGLSVSRVGRAGAGYAPEEILGQIAIIRGTPGASGEILFSMRALLDDRRPIAGVLAEGPYREAAVIPASPWLGGQPPAAPRVEVAEVTGEPLELTIKAAPGSSPFLWAVQIRREGVWTTTIHPAGQSRVRIEAAKSGSATLVVTAVDRLGNASEPVVLER